MNAEQMRVVVFGCGGIGGCFTARLAQAGCDVVVVTHNAGITAAVTTQGLRAGFSDGAVTVRVDVVTDAKDARGPFDVALLAVPPNRIEAAAEQARTLLRPGGLLVPLANGLPEERLVERYGDDAVVGCIVSFGASAVQPGVVEQTSEGGLTIGRLSGNVDSGVRRVATLLHAAFDPRQVQSPDNVTTNLRGARFSKLAINCAISSLGTIGGDTLGSLMRHRFSRRLCLEVMTEAVQTATGLGVRLEKLSNTVDLEWLALDNDERLMVGSPSLLAKHTVLLAVGAKYRRLRSSMLAAIERGRDPPIEYLNGEVVLRARALGVDTPINAAIVDTVHAIARGDKRPSVDALRELFDATRITLRELRLAA